MARDSRFKDIRAQHSQKQRQYPLTSAEMREELGRKRVVMVVILILGQENTISSRVSSKYGLEDGGRFPFHVHHGHR
eukprot:4333127-Amphidinium_carterae.1